MNSKIIVQTYWWDWLKTNLDNYVLLINQKSSFFSVIGSIGPFKEVKPLNDWLKQLTSWQALFIIAILGRWDAKFG